MTLLEALIQAWVPEGRVVEAEQDGTGFWSVVKHANDVAYWSAPHTSYLNPNVAEEKWYESSHSRIGYTGRIRERTK
jgi:hypothetical protein